MKNKNEKIEKSKKSKKQKKINNERENKMELSVGIERLSAGRSR